MAWKQLWFSMVQPASVDHENRSLRDRRSKSSIGCRIRHAGDGGRRGESVTHHRYKTNDRNKRTNSEITTVCPFFALSQGFWLEVECDAKTEHGLIPSGYTGCARACHEIAEIEAQAQ